MQLMRELPADPGTALVIVQHLDPTHESALAGLLGESTELPVVQVTDGMSVEENRVYVIPPNAQMGVVEGKLRLMPRPRQPQRIHADRFLLSLAGRICPRPGDRGGALGDGLGRGGGAARNQGGGRDHHRAGARSSQV